MEFRPRQPRRGSRSRFEVAMRQRQAAVRTHIVSSRVRMVLFVSVLVVGLCSIAISWYTGEAWQIHDIKVQNNNGVPVAQIIGASGIQGEHMQWVDLDAAATRINDLSGIQAARVTCRWQWQADCVIQVQETRALAVWQSSKGNVWVDGEGRVQQVADSTQAGAALKAPIMISVEEDADVPPTDQPLDPRLLHALMELNRVQPDVHRYLYSREFGLMYVDARNWRVRLGISEREGAMTEKLTLARKLADSILAQGGNARVLDVRFVQAPFYLK